MECILLSIKINCINNKYNDEETRQFKRKEGTQKKDLRDGTLMFLLKD